MEWLPFLLEELEMTNDTNGWASDKGTIIGCEEMTGYGDGISDGNGVEG